MVDSSGPDGQQHLSVVVAVALARDYHPFQQARNDKSACVMEVINRIIT